MNFVVDNEKFRRYIGFFFVSSLHRKRNGHIVDSKRDVRRERMEGGDPENIALIIRDVTRHDMGNYTCELENEYGMGVSEDSIIVNVYCKYISWMFESKVSHHHSCLFLYLFTLFVY